MKHSRGITLLAAGALIGLTGCDAGANPRQTAVAELAVPGDRPPIESKSRKMKVTIGGKTFTAALEEDSAADRFRAMLPLTLDMGELNGNEKFSRLSAPLSTDATDPGTIRAGDLMLWGSDTLVLFYETFRTGYSYTRLGRIDDPTGLAAAVGSGHVSVTFELE